MPHNNKKTINYTKDRNVCSFDNVAVFGFQQRSKEFLQITNLLNKHLIEFKEKNIRIVMPNKSLCNTIATQITDELEQKNLQNKVQIRCLFEIDETFNSSTYQFFFKIINCLGKKFEIKKVLDIFLSNMCKLRKTYLQELCWLKNNLDKNLERELMTSKNLKTLKFQNIKLQKRLEHIQLILKEIQTFANSLQKQNDIKKILDKHTELWETLAIPSTENDETWYTLLNKAKKTILKMETQLSFDYIKFVKNLPGMSKKEIKIEKCYNKNVPNITISTPFGSPNYENSDCIIFAALEEKLFPETSANTPCNVEQTKNILQNILSSNAKKIIFSYSGTRNIYKTKNHWLEILIAQAKRNGKNLLSLKNEEIKKSSPISKIKTTNHPKIKVDITKRPKHLSVTSIEKMITNPYSFCVEYILKLAHKKENNVKSYIGTIIHNFIDEISKDEYLNINIEKPERFIQTANKIIEKTLELKIFKQNTMLGARKYFLQKKLRLITKWFFQRYQNLSNYKRMGELKVLGDITLFDQKKNKEIILSIEARIDELYQDKNQKIIELIDYKTGKIPTAEEIKLGLKPQIVLQSWLIKDKICRNSKIGFIKLLGKSNMIAKEQYFNFALSNNIEDELKRVLKTFYIECIPYYATKTFYKKSHLHLARYTNLL